jgi:hypothetical protein
MEVTQIRSNCIEVTWPYVKDLLAKPLERNSGEYNLEDIYELLVNESMQLWLGLSKKNGIVVAAITQLNKYPRMNTVTIALVGAKTNTIDDWLDYCVSDESAIVKYAKENNAKHIEIIARDGWKRKLEKFNYKKYATVLTKEL